MIFCVILLVEPRPGYLVVIQIGLGTHDPADTPAFAFPKEMSNIMNHESQIFFQLNLILLIVDLDCTVCIMSAYYALPVLSGCNCVRNQPKTIQRALDHVKTGIYFWINNATSLT